MELAALKLTCPHCGAPIRLSGTGKMPESCSNCGAPLDPNDLPAPPPEAPESPKPAPPAPKPVPAPPEAKPAPAPARTKPTPAPEPPAPKTPPVVEAPRPVPPSPPPAPTPIPIPIPIPPRGDEPVPAPVPAPTTPTSPAPGGGVAAGLMRFGIHPGRLWAGIIFAAGGAILGLLLQTLDASLAVVLAAAGFLTAIWARASAAMWLAAVAIAVLAAIGSFGPPMVMLLIPLAVSVASVPREASARRWIALVVAGAFSAWVLWLLSVHYGRSPVGLVWGVVAAAALASAHRLTAR